MLKTFHLETGEKDIEEYDVDANDLDKKEEDDIPYPSKKDNYATAREFSCLVKGVGVG